MKSRGIKKNDSNLFSLLGGQILWVFCSCSDQPAASEESHLWVQHLQQQLENSYVVVGQDCVKTREEGGGVKLLSLILMMQNKAKGNFRQWLNQEFLINP